MFTSNSEQVICKTDINRPIKTD